MYPSIEYIERSRPVPDCLNPPNGVVIEPLSKVFTQTVPERNLRAMRCAFVMSRVQIDDAKPYVASTMFGGEDAEDGEEYSEDQE